MHSHKYVRDAPEQPALVHESPVAEVRDFEAQRRWHLRDDLRLLFDAFTPPLEIAVLHPRDYGETERWRTVNFCIAERESIGALPIRAWITRFCNSLGSARVTQYRLMSAINLRYALAFSSSRMRKLKKKPRT